MKPIAIALISICLFLSGCGQKAPVEDPLCYVYASTELTLPMADYGFSQDSEITWDGQRFSITAFRMDENAGFWHDDTITCTFSPTESQLTQVSATAETKTGTDTPNANQTFPLLNGETLVTEAIWQGEEAFLELILLDTDGQETFRMDFASEFGFAYRRHWEGDGVFRLLAALCADTTAGMRYLVLTTDGLCALDETGQVSWIHSGERYPGALLETDFGIVYLYGETNKQRLRPVDPITGELGEDILLPEELTVSGGTFVVGDGYDLYMKNALALWGIDFVTNEEDNTLVCQSEKVVDWSVSALTPAEIVQIVIADTENMAILTRDSLTQDVTAKLFLLTHVPREEVVEKETITLAMVLDGDRIPRAIANFNKSSDTHRIVVQDYTRYDEEVRKTFFDAELAAGNIPDIVIFDDRDGAVDGYEKNGLFADLTPLFAADEMLSTELLGYVTKPYQRANNCQYVFPLMPSYDMVWGSTSVFDGPASVEDILALYETHSAAEMSTYGVYTLQGMFLRFTDLDTGKCYFDSPLFLTALETVRACTSNEKWEGERLTENLYLTDGLYGWALHNLQYGDRLTPIGLPVDGEQLYALDNYDYLGITATSPYQEECIEFLKCYLATQGAQNDRFFTRSQVYAEVTEYADISICLTPDGPQMIEDQWLTDPELHEIILENNPALLTGITEIGYKLTMADADDFIAFLDDIDGILPRNTALYKIYWEECYWSENPSAAEIAQSVQSRGSVYLSEVYN